MMHSANNSHPNLCLLNVCGKTRKDTAIMAPASVDFSLSLSLAISRHLELFPVNFCAWHWQFGSSRAPSIHKPGGYVYAGLVQATENGNGSIVCFGYPTRKKKNVFPQQCACLKTAETIREPLG